MWRFRSPHVYFREFVGGLPNQSHTRTNKLLEPISKLPEQDNEASELNESEEVLGVVFPTDEETALPLDPGEEALDEPAPRVTAEPSSILRERLSAIGAMRCNHLDALSSQLLVQRVAVVGAVTDQILRLGFDHVEVEAQLHPADFVMAACVLTDSGNPW